MRYRRYPSDLTDAQWALVAPHIPSAKSGGRPCTTDVRAVLDAIIYLLRTGCQWRQLPSGICHIDRLRNGFGQYYAS